MANQRLVSIHCLYIYSSDSIVLVLVLCPSYPLAHDLVDHSHMICAVQVPLLLQLQRSDPQYDRKLSFWSRDACLPSRRVRVSVGENENTRLLFSILRMLAANEDDLEILTTSYGGFYRAYNENQGPISLRNELAAMRLLATVCTDYLSRYPSTLDEDLKRLADVAALAPFSNERHAVIQVKGEKEVLHFYKRFAEKAAAMLSMRLGASAEFEHELQQLRANTKEHPMLFQYCRTVVTRLRGEEQQRQISQQRNVDLSKPTVV